MKSLNVTKSLIMLSLIVPLTSACQTDISERPKETIGNILGAGLGGLLGSQFGSGKGQLAAVAAGALAGAYFGGGVLGQKVHRQWLLRLKV